MSKEEVEFELEFLHEEDEEEKVSEGVRKEGSTVLMIEQQELVETGGQGTWVVAPTLHLPYSSHPPILFLKIFCVFIFTRCQRASPSFPYFFSIEEGSSYAHHPFIFSHVNGQTPINKVSVFLYFDLFRFYF